MKLAFGALSLLYAEVSRAKNRFYERGWLKPVSVGVPVISLGNLTVGGTGKTPLADFCLQRLLARGRRPGVIARSYRTPLKVPSRVDPRATGAAGIYGDEPTWLAARYPQVPVWSGPRKWETAQAFMRAENVDVILLDDGFQHRKLHRDLDLVLLDATEERKNYACVPLGRGREEFENLRRASAIILTKTNLASAEQLAKLRQDIAFAEKPVFEFGLKLGGLEEASDGHFLLVSGIARPQSFLDLARQTAPQGNFHVLRFSDHHPYSAADVVAIRERAQSVGAKTVLTTEKDETKLRALWTGSDVTLKALPLEVRPPASVQSFDDLLQSVF